MAKVRQHIIAEVAFVVWLVAVVVGAWLFTRHYPNGLAEVEWSHVVVAGLITLPGIIIPFFFNRD